MLLPRLNSPLHTNGRPASVGDSGLLVGAGDQGATVYFTKGVHQVTIIAYSRHITADTATKLAQQASGRL